MIEKNKWSSTLFQLMSVALFEGYYYKTRVSLKEAILSFLVEAIFLNVKQSFTLKSSIATITRNCYEHQDFVPSRIQKNLS